MYFKPKFQIPSKNYQDKIKQTNKQQKKTILKILKELKKGLGENNQENDV